jgi:ATP dependent DNA ligase domain
VHEIKHDGYRMIARRTGDRVQLYTRRGFNWADRYPRIVEALRSLRVRSIVIDGEADAGRGSRSRTRRARPCLRIEGTIPMARWHGRAPSSNNYP